VCNSCFIVNSSNFRSLRLDNAPRLFRDYPRERVARLVNMNLFDVCVIDNENKQLLLKAPPFLWMLGENGLSVKSVYQVM
jgi:hypothetical protein